MFLAAQLNRLQSRVNQHLDLAGTTVMSPDLRCRHTVDDDARVVTPGTARICLRRRRLTWLSMKA